MGLDSRMNLKVIGSGSSGNAYVLETEKGSLMIECGLPLRKIQQAMNFSMTGVQGLLLSHFHQDHSRCINDVMRSGIEVFTGKGTSESLTLVGHRLNIVEEGKQFNVGDFTVLPFPTEHDAEGSMGFLIYHKPTKIKICFATDTYYIRHRFTGLNFLLIECNYCKDTLDYNIENGYIAREMKNRLLESHFSLEHVKGFLTANDLSKVQKIVLLHLSYHNADSERMIREISELTGKDVVIADAGKEIPLEMCPF